MNTAVNRILNRRPSSTLFQRGQISLSQINLRSCPDIVFMAITIQFFRRSVNPLLIFENELDNAVQNLDVELKLFEFKIWSPSI